MCLLLNTFLILDFGDDFDVFAFLAENLSDFMNGRRVSDEGGEYDINLVK